MSCQKCANRIPADHCRHRVWAITPDSKTAFVTRDASGTVTLIMTATSTAGPPITVGASPYATAITPAPALQGPPVRS
jgi:hypothetical protein